MINKQVASSAPGDPIRCLHQVCGATLADTISSGREAEVARLYVASSELETWNNILSTRGEHALFATAQREHLVALLNLCQGQYRNAFKGLRLVLELYLQGVFLSVDAIGLYEWLEDAKDTNWNAIMDTERGVFSVRLCKAFFPDLSNKVSTFNTLARTLYRELSECTHGNIGKSIPLPVSLEFDEETFKTWVEKATTTSLVIHFALAMRYLNSVSTDDRTKLEPFLSDELGHIAEVRVLLGGTAT